MLVWFAGVANMVQCNQHNSKLPAEEQGKRTTPAQRSTNEESERPGNMDGEIKQLAAGSHCTVSESFVFVARDLQTYQALESLKLNLPTQSPDFFKSHAVVAAFLGQRRTGGFSVEITQNAAGGVQVIESKPKGMVTMVLTTPFKIVAVPVKADGTIALTVDATWQERLRSYRLTSGALTITGGFAGVHQTLGLEGTLQIMREKNLATFFFELQSTGKRQAQMRDLTSGTVADSGSVSVSYLDSHSLSGAIQSPFKTTGQFTQDEMELTLNLETVDSPNITDNFSASASLKAIATTQRPPNRAITGSE